LPLLVYWGKKILEWCNTPEYAFRTTLELSNRYFIDGRDFNAFSGVACVFGNQDRGWTERAEAARGAAGFLRQA
jgi:deoxyribodipyrimidine photo-lyase